MDAILLAAGKGVRMKSEVPKQFICINGKPVFIYALELFDKCKFIENIYVTCNIEHIADYKRYISEYRIESAILVEGGATRQESVYNALQMVSTESVIIHEAARPLVDLFFLEEIINADLNCAAVVPTIPIKFTVAIGDRFMQDELDREKLHNIQLPQLFNTKVLLESHLKAINDKYYSTEDGMLVFHYGNKVKFVKGRESNIKITTQLDIELVERLLKL